MLYKSSRHEQSIIENKKSRGINLEFPIFLSFLLEILRLKDTYNTHNRTIDSDLIKGEKAEYLIPKIAKIANDRQ